MADLMAQVLDCIKLPRSLRLELTDFGWSASWKRQYACGEISDRRNVEGASQDEVLAAILEYERDSDRIDASFEDRCLTCFPLQAEPGKEGA